MTLLQGKKICLKDIFVQQFKTVTNETIYLTRLKHIKKMMQYTKVNKLELEKLRHKISSEENYKKKYISDEKKLKGKQT